MYTQIYNIYIYIYTYVYTTNIHMYVICHSSLRCVGGPQGRTGAPPFFPAALAPLARRPRARPSSGLRTLAIRDPRSGRFFTGANNL